MHCWPATCAARQYHFVPACVRAAACDRAFKATFCGLCCFGFLGPAWVLGLIGCQDGWVLVASASRLVMMLLLWKQVQTHLLDTKVLHILCIASTALQPVCALAADQQDCGGAGSISRSLCICRLTVPPGSVPVGQLRLPFTPT